MARKFFAWVEIGKAVRNMDPVALEVNLRSLGTSLTEYLKHIPDPSWPATNLERCAHELRPRCFQCKCKFTIHFSAVDYSSWALQYRDEWPYVYFEEEAGWDIDNGICPECQYAAMAAGGRQN
jgi:hypothetical protein